MIIQPHTAVLKGEFVPTNNLQILIQLNQGALWVKLEDGDVLLFGADSASWEGKDNLYIIKDGAEIEIPASTQMKGYYDQVSHTGAE